MRPSLPAAHGVRSNVDRAVAIAPGDTAEHALDEALRRTRGRKVAPSIRDAILEISGRCAALPDLDTRSAEEILG